MGGGKGQGFDLQPVLLAEQPIEIETQGMGGQLGIQAGVQHPEAVSMIALNLKMLRQLPVHRFDDLADHIAISRGNCPGHPSKRTAT
jgi:hypothetical protein